MCDDLEDDTNPEQEKQVNKTEITVTLSEESIQAIVEALKNNHKFEEYINDSVSEWFNENFEIQDHVGDSFKSDIAEAVIEEMEDRIEVSSDISIRFN